jgi:hypothetical protein
LSIQKVNQGGVGSLRETSVRASGCLLEVVGFDDLLWAWEARVDLKVWERMGNLEGEIFMGSGQ